MQKLENDMLELQIISRLKAGGLNLIFHINITFSSTFMFSAHPFYLDFSRNAHFQSVVLLSISVRVCVCVCL